MHVISRNHLDLTKVNFESITNKTTKSVFIFDNIYFRLFVFIYKIQGKKEERLGFIDIIQSSVTNDVSSTLNGVNDTKRTALEVRRRRRPARLIPLKLLL